MDYLLERKVKLNLNTEYKNLYSWCLNEFDENSKQVGSDWIPFRWTFWFTGASLHLETRLSLECETNINVALGNKPVKSSAKVKKSLHGKFFSGVCFDGKNLIRQVEFSILGTGRPINQFGVSINEAQSEDDEVCWLTVCPSYESEDVNFNKTIEDDFAAFDVYIAPEKFAELVKLVENRSLDSITFTASNIDGVYAYWTPTIATRDAKFLTSNDVVSKNENDVFEGKVTSIVGEFNISFTTNSHLNLRGFANNVDSEIEIEGINGNKTIESDSTTSTINKDDTKIATMQLIQSIKSLKTVLWILFVAILLLIAK